MTVKDWRESKEKSISKIINTFKDKILVVRSRAESEDSFSHSNAGGYESVLNVDPKNDLEPAIKKVIDSYGEMCTDDDQVLIQPMLLNVQLSGVAFTRTLEHSAPWYVINYETSGDTEAITSGNSSNHNTWIVRKKISNPELFYAPDKRLHLLVVALKEIEELLGYDALDVEFAIDSNQIIHILQVRPITVKSYQAKISDNTYDDFIESAQASFKTLSVHLLSPWQLTASYGSNA